MGIEVENPRSENYLLNHQCEAKTIPIKISYLSTHQNILEQAVLFDEIARLERRTLKMLKNIRKFKCEIGEQNNSSNSQIPKKLTEGIFVIKSISNFSFYYINFSLKL